MIAVARDQRQLNEQIRVIVDFLSDGRTDEDALATCSRGWRPRDWKPGEGPCSAENCKAEHDHSPHPRHTGRWQSEVDRCLDRWPRHVVLGVPRAINGMPLLDRLVVRGRTSMNILSWVKLGDFAGCSDKTARAHYDAALVRIAELVWTDEGEPIW